MSPHAANASGARRTELDALLQGTVDEAAGLLDAAGAMVYLLEPDGATLRLANDAGVTSRPDMRWARGLQLAVGAGMFGRAVAERRVQVTTDYPVDETFPHAEGPDRVVQEVGIRSMVVAPLVSGDRVFGALGVFSTRPDDFADGDIGLVRALASHAALAIANAQLIEELARSREALAARAESERTLREIGARLVSIREPGDLLQRVVDEAGRLVGAEGTILGLIGEDGLIHWRYDDGVRLLFDPAYVETLTLGIGVGLSGRAVAEGRVAMCNEDLVNAFPRSPESDHFFEVSGFRSLLAAPIVGESGPLGVLEAYATREHAFAEEDAGVISALADQAAVAIGNARLIQALADSEERYRHLVRTSPDVVWAIDADGHFTFMSDRIEEVSGFRPEDVIGHHFSQLVDPVSMATTVGAWEDIRRDPAGVERIAILLVQREGPSTPVEIWATGLVRDGRFAGAHGSLRDVSERDRLERELRESEARYRYLVDNSPDMVWSTNADGRFSYVSESSERLLGWRPEELVGQPWAAVVHPDAAPESPDPYERAAAETRSRELRYRFDALRRDGTRVPLEMHARTIVDERGYAGAHGAVRDLSERERLERDLQRQAGEIAASQERAHLARELHDSVTQALFSMGLVTSSVEILLKRDPGAAVARLEVLRDLQRDALAEMRALIFELRPASLETDGLVAALRTHAAAVRGRSGLPVVVDVPDLERLPIEVEAALFRIAQEALHNVVKHAGARSVRLSLAVDGRLARLAVEDDGAGFDPLRVAGGHLGLAGMRARAEKLGGRLDVRSEHGRGTRITVEIPREKAEP